MNILTYSASSGKVPQQYVDAATTLARLMAQEGHTLINGGGRTGLMGALTDAIIESGGKAIGVIPQFMVNNNWQHNGMTQLIVTENMHERKEQMSRLSDAVIALPGGVGTMEEMLEIITWKQLGLYLKPIVVFNIDGYYDALLSQLRRAIDENIMRPLHNDLWRVASTPAEALELAKTTPLWDPSFTKLAAI